MKHSKFVFSSATVKQIPLIFITLLIAIFYFIPIYVEFDFDTNGEDIYPMDVSGILIMHTLFLLLWFLFCFLGNKLLRVVSQILMLTISLFYCFLAIGFVFGEAKHLYPLIGSYLLFAYFPIILLFFIKVKRVI